MPAEKSDVQFLLQLTEAVGKGRRRHEQRACSFGQVFLFNDREKDLNVAFGHGRLRKKNQVMRKDIACISGWSVHYYNIGTGLGRRRKGKE